MSALGAEPAALPLEHALRKTADNRRPWKSAPFLPDTNYTTSENIVLILAAILVQSKTEFLIQLHSGIPFLLQQRAALVLA